MKANMLTLCAALVACTADDGGDGELGSSGTTGDAPTTTVASTSSASESSSSGATTMPDDDSGTTAGSADSSDATGEASGSSDTGQPSSDARDWIVAHFADAPVVSGDFDERTQVELPALVMDATGTNAKYAFETRDDEAPMGPEVGFVGVQITDLVSGDAFGGAIQTGNSPGAIVYIDDLHVEPNWPAWQDYDTTNYDGIVLDESAELYAEDLTIVSWNADSAIDIKAQLAQFVRLDTMGGGNRTLRFWASGPHYLVESSVNNPDGTVMWFSDCATVTLYVYDSTFNGASQVAEGDVECDNGSAPNIVYLDTDPRTTGELHPMFSP